MNTTIRIVIVAVVLIAAFGVTAVKQQPARTATDEQSRTTTPADVLAESAASVPHLIDLGAGKCVPCKMMMPILDQLREDFHGQFEVTVIDILEDRAAGDAYGVQIIPTQIFFDADGNELFRHEGFYSRDEILEKWRELGFAFESALDGETGS